MTESKVKMDKLIWALESHARRDFDEFYLDKMTGDILSADLLSSKNPELFKQIEQNPNQYVLVRPLPAHDIASIIDDFLDSLEDSKAKDRLQDIMMEQSSLRAFEEAAADFPQVNKQWKAYHALEMEMIAREWLRNQEIEI